MSQSSYLKYLKYKAKYLELKRSQIGSGNTDLLKEAGVDEKIIKDFSKAINKLTESQVNNLILLVKAGFEPILSLKAISILNIGESGEVGYLIQLKNIGIRDEDLIFGSAASMFGMSNFRDGRITDVKALKNIRVSDEYCIGGAIRHGNSFSGPPGGKYVKYLVEQKGNYEANTIIGIANTLRSNAISKINNDENFNK